MPRKARVLVPNCPHHVVQRGHNKKAVFIEPEDYNYYLSNLKEWKQELNIKIYAWCLMTNHIHLVVEPGDDPMSLSVLMKRINGRQSAYINKLEGRSGSLWEGRYKASPIQRETYLLSCLRYVELNPVKAGMVVRPEDYCWSSFSERTGDRDYGLLDYDDVYLALGLNYRERIATYRKFIEQGIPATEQNFLQRACQRNQLSGNEYFIDEIEQRIGLRIAYRGRGRPVKSRK